MYTSEAIAHGFFAGMFSTGAALSFTPGQNWILGIICLAIAICCIGATKDYRVTEKE